MRAIDYERQIDKGVGLAAILVAALACPACGNDASTPAGAGGSGATSTGSTGSTANASTATGASTSATSSGGSTSTGASIPPLDECSVSQPEWIFCDSFETGQPWDGTTTNPVLLDEPGPFSLAGNHAAQLRVPPGSGGSGLYKDLMPQPDVAYLRFYVMWEPGHDFTALRHGPGGLHGGDTNCVGCSGSRPDNWFTSTLETVTKSPFTMQAYTYYPGMYMDCADPNGSCWGDMFPCTAGSNYCTNPDHAPSGPLPEMQAGQWYCLEQMIDAGMPTPGSQGASGVLDFWIDGLEIGPWPDLWFRSSASTRLSALWLYLYHHADHSVEGLLIDNVVVSTSRVGCPG